MYNLEIQKAIESITGSKARRVLIQLPDGLKPKAKEIQNEVAKKTGAEVIIWAGSCFGACDVPHASAKLLGADLIIQWGHSQWK